MAVITLQNREYTIKNKIARGGQGIVWEAENGGSKPVVLKELYGIVAGDQSDPEISDVEEQVRILRQLQGVPGIPELIDAGFADDGRYYVAMNHVPGKTLEEHVREGKRYTKEEARGMLQQLLLTLGECHTRGLIHRDVKPDNIKMYDGQAIFVDVSSFGDALAKTQTLAVGTLGYIAPEQKELQTKPASDIYGLGKTLYHILTREDISAFNELKHSDFEGIREVYGSGFGDILEKMCQPELARRYKTVREVLHDLEVGDVTEKFALAKTEQRGIVKRWAASAWDWLRYESINLYDEHGARTKQLILQKRFGDGPECVVIDSDGKPLYGTDTMEFKETVTTNPGFYEHFHRLLHLNGEGYMVFRLANGKQALISEDGEMFGEMFDGLVRNRGSDSPIRIEEGTTTDYIRVEIRPKNKTGLVSQFMGKDGLMGLQDAEISALELFNKDGWTRVTKNNKQALVLPDGKIFGNAWFDHVSTAVAQDSSGTLYVPVTEEHKIQMVNEKGEGFGPKINGRSIKSSKLSGVKLGKLKTSFETWNGKEYVYYHWDGIFHNDYPFIAHTYLAHDGSLIGGDVDWSHVQFLQGPQEQYAVCQKYKTNTNIPETTTIVDKNNALLFGGAHKAFEWYDSQGDLEVVCFTTTKDGTATKTVKTKKGDELYLSGLEAHAQYTVTLQRVSPQAVVYDDGFYTGVIRQVLMGYDQNIIGAAHTTRGNSSELRTEAGAIICFDTEGDIQSFGKTADNRISVMYSNGKTEIIDVRAKMEKPTYWEPKKGSVWK